MTNGDVGVERTQRIWVCGSISAVMVLAAWLLLLTPLEGPSLSVAVVFFGIASGVAGLLFVFDMLILLFG